MASVSLGSVTGSITSASALGGSFGYIPVSVPVFVDADVGLSSRAGLINTSVSTVLDYRLVVVNMAGEPITELTHATPASVVLPVTGFEQVDFTITLNDPKAIWVQPLRHEVQLWRGQRLLFWGPVVRVSDDGKFLHAQCQDPSFYFTRRVFGPVPKKNLLDGNRWMATWLPRSSPATPPARSYSADVRYGGAGDGWAVQMSSTTGKTEAVRSNDDLYSNRSLTATGKAQISAIVSDTFGDNPVITVEVYDDNSLDRKDSLDRAEDRAQAVADYIFSLKPSARIIVNANGLRYPIASNATAAGRTTNRRTTFTYRDNDGTKGGKQVLYQRFYVRNPKSGEKRRTYTARAYSFLKNVAGFAAGFAGMELVVMDPTKPHPDPAWAKRGYHKVTRRKVSTIGPDTPLRAWVAHELSVTLPNDGRPSIIEMRLYTPNGDIVWDEWWLTPDDALWFKEEEQADILRDILDHAQNESLGKSDLNIDRHIPNTGVKRTRAYFFEERQTVYDALAEFPTLANGVEWSIVPRQDKRRVFTTYYPRRGAETDVVLANGSDIVSYTVDADGTELADSVVIQNSGTDSDLHEERSITDATLLDGLVLEKVYAATPNSPASSWSAQARRGLARYRRNVIITKVVLDPERTSDLLKRVHVGDRVTVRIEDDRMETIQRHRVTQIELDPTSDQLTYSLYPEDIKVKPRLRWQAEGWRYFHQSQGSIVGANGTRPVESNVAYAAPDFDDSGWATGQGGIGWIKEATGGSLVQAWQTPNTVVTEQHEVWMRKKVRCTGDMRISMKGSDWAFLYINGRLYTGSHFVLSNRRGSGAFYRQIPADWLDPSGIQTIALHCQYDPSKYNSAEMDSIYADVSVTGTYDERLVL